MSTRNRPTPGRWLRVLTIALWALFAGGNLLLWLIMESAPFVLSVLLLLALFTVELGLLARYNRPLAQWRTLGLAWLCYGLARMAADRAAAAGSATATTMLMLLALYAMTAGFGVLAILAIRRDVSVIYFLLPFAVMPLLMQSLLRASGGLIVLLWGPALQPGELAPFTWLEPLTMVLSCMIPLAFVTFWGHLFRLLAREQRREPLTGLPAAAASAGVEP